MKKALLLLFIVLICQPALLMLAEKAYPDSKKDVDHHASPSVAHGIGDDFIIATVNGSGITWTALESKMREIGFRKYRRQEITPALAERIKNESLDQLIMEELAFQWAKSLGITTTPEEIASQIKDTEAKWGGGKHFQQYKILRNWNAEDVWNNAERTLAVQKALEMEVFSNIETSEEDLRKFFAENREKYIQQEMVRITDIVFFLDPDAAEDVLKAESVRKKLMSELDGDPTRLAPDNTFVVRKDIKLYADRTPDLYTIAKTLSPNEVSSLFTADGKLHIIKLKGYLPRIEKTFEQVKAQVKTELYSRKKDRALQQWRNRLREENDIKILE